jgi:hypothetical protein
MHPMSCFAVNFLFFPSAVQHWIFKKTRDSEGILPILAVNSALFTIIKKRGNSMIALEPQSSFERQPQ